MRRGGTGAGWAMVAAALVVQPIAGTVPVTPVPTGAETQRFLHGTPTLTLETATGAVEVTPLPFDHGHVVFGVAVFNKGPVAANFGVEDVDAAIGGRMLAVLPEAELARRAKSRALWSQVGIAVLAGAAAGIAAGGATTRAHGTVRDPGGARRWTAATHDAGAGAIGAGVAAAGGAAGIVGVRERLDQTLNELAADVVQTTTVDPQASYGGRLVLEKPEGASPPYDLMLVVHWNGADYPFSFHVGQGAGTPRAPTVAAALPRSAPLPTLPPGPVRPAVLVELVPAPPSVPAPATTAGPPRDVARPAPVSGYRNGRDDAVIVPMR